MSPRPPLFARLVLRLVPMPHRAYVAGDLYEEYSEHMVPRRGWVVATLWLGWQTIRTAAVFLRYRPRRRERRRWSGPRLSHAYRSWRRRPGFALLASATLGVGIGAATSVFGAADWILFRPVPGVDDSDRLVMIEFRDPHGGAAGISFPNLRDLAVATPGLSHLAAHTALSVQAVASSNAPVSLVAEVVTGEYFAMLGGRAAAGRLIRAEDADGSAGRTVVVSHEVWNRAFDLSPDAIGSSIRLNGHTFTVVGVAPEGFRGVNRMLDVDLWVGGAQYAALRHAPPGLDWSMTARGAPIFQSTLGRLRDDGDGATVEAQLRAGMRALVSAYPRLNEPYRTRLATVYGGIGLRPVERAGVASIVRAFAIVVVVTLLIACANVANLLVVRGIKRRGELAVRRALGESSTHFYLQHTVEALLLAVPAALFGLFVAVGLNRWFWAAGFLPTGPVPDVTIDWRVAGFAVGLAMVTALAFSLLPAAVASRATIASHVNASRGAAGRVTWMQGTLTVSQLALSLALLAGAVVLARTIGNLHRVDLGFSPENVTVYRLDPGPQGYSHERNVAFHRRVLEEMQTTSGATASTAIHEPFGETFNYVRVVSPAAEGDTMLIRANWIADDYLGTLDIPLFEGSTFERGTAGPVVILSRHTARQLFGERRAVGRTITVLAYSGPESRRVVGVVGDVVGWNPRASTPGLVYLPLADTPAARAALLVRTTMPQQELNRVVGAAVNRVDPNVPVPAADPMPDRVAMSMAQERSLARIIGLLAFLACGLAGVGLYSVIAYATAERTREFGIRLALGASDERIVWSVFVRSGWFGAWGIGAGTIASIGLSRVIGSRVYGVEALDPVSLGLAAAVLFVLSVAAAVMPAVSASRVDPIRSLAAS